MAHQISKTIQGKRSTLTKTGRTHSSKSKKEE